MDININSYYGRSSFQSGPIDLAKKNAKMIVAFIAVAINKFLLRMGTMTNALKADK